MFFSFVKIDTQEKITVTKLLCFRRKEPTERGARGVSWGWGVEDDDGDGEASSLLTTDQMRDQQQRLLRGERNTGVTADMRERERGTERLT